MNSVDKLINQVAATMAGEAGITICKNCKHLILPSKDAREWMWLCHAQPQALQFSYLSGQDYGTPYAECRRVNTNGHCPFYEEGINSLSPDKLVRDGHGNAVIPKEK